MPQRLSVLDASFLRLESSTTPLHTGGLDLFPAGLRFSDVLATLQARIDAVPLARKRVHSVAWGGRPVWVDDGDFDLSYHLRHAALPAPGDARQLGEFLSRLMGRQLDRSRPLWELYVVEGLAGGHVGVFRKVHLSMAGGDRGDPFAVLLDDLEGGNRLPAEAPAPWRAAPAPSRLELTAEAATEGAARLGRLGRSAGRVLRPHGLAHAAGAVAGSAVGVAGRLVRLAPPSPLNRTLSPHRRVTTARVRLEELRRIRRAFGATINDIVVSVTGDAIGRLLRRRGHETRNLDLRVMVPVRVHPRPGGDPPDQPATVGDNVVGVLAPLPVMAIDPVARLYRVMGELAGLKESRQAVAAEHLVRLAGYAPPNLHGLAARLASAEHRYDVALSNAPGPQTPRYLAGQRLEESYALIPLAGDSVLSIAVSSYDGGVYFGLLGDRDGMPDLAGLPALLLAAVADLAAAAAGAAASTPD